MAKNDKILIDGIIDERAELKIPSDKRDEVFEYFAFEQILKDYDLSNEEIIFGSIDGRNDGGIDGFFIFINGHLLNDVEKFNWPKSGSILEIWIITCKHHDTFRQAPLDNLAASISELFDLSIENSNLKSDYSEELLSLRYNFRYAYRKVSPRLSKFKINFCYASRGNSDEIGDSIFARANQIKQISEDCFGNCNSNFEFVGSTELIELNRRSPNFTLELPFSDDLSNGETYVLLVKLKDFYNFITDNEKLRRYLFDSNVRDFMGLNRVNEDIKNTLLNEDSPDFWWLNNGITILATGAGIVGKSILIEDIQIVNGLQTSESIYRYFSSGNSDKNERSVLVKVIVSKDNQIRDEIIRATNNQTTVEMSALHATDKIQRDIEEVLLMHDFFYERRTNFYKNQGIAPEKIITPLYMAAGFVSLILKAPEQASVLRAKFMRSEISYDRVFSTSTDLEIWPQIAFVLKQTDKFLETKRPGTNSVNEYFLKFRRHFLSFITISRLLGDFNFSIYDLIKIDLENYNLVELEKSWKIMSEVLPQSFIKSKVKRELLIELCAKLNISKDIKGYDRLLHKFGLVEPYHGNKGQQIPVDDEFIEKVNTLLPVQPWKPGIHKSIAIELGCSVGDIFAATESLMKAGKRYWQKDGVIYNNNGDIVKIDESRVDPKTLKLKEE